MYRLFFIVSDLLSAAVVLIPFLLLLLSVLWNGNSPRRRGLLLIFTLFIVAVYSAVGLPSIAGIHVDPEVHLIPLLDGWSSPLSYLKNMLLNTLLFLPLGFLLPVLWEGARSFKRVFLFGVCLSLGIELLQLLNFRLTDVDDLIANTAGALLGYLLFHVLNRNERLSLPCGDAKGPGPVVLCLLAFGVVFLVLPFLPTLTDLLYPA
ncbi:MAG: VanZ family protein [Clostridiales bacterium]|nr:VanZ family protein [Clostridiales bacterium]MDY4171305.1 VanZ family protein [Evtepia sp.]